MNKNESENTILLQQKSVKPVFETRDLFFALLFVCNVAAIFVLMGFYGVGVHVANINRQMAGYFFAAVVVAVLVTFLMLKLVISFAFCVITFALWFTVALFTALAIGCFYQGVIVGGVILAVCSVLSIWYACAIRSSIPFAAANLKVAQKALIKHKSTYLIALVMILVQIAYLFVWFITINGVLDKKNEKAVIIKKYSKSQNAYVVKTEYSLTGGEIASCFFAFFSIFWGLSVFSNIVHVTVAGTVGSYCFNPNSAGATGASFKRSLTTSFGSICLGSLLVAILQALRAMVSMIEGNDCAKCIAKCILDCLEGLMEYFNRWAFVYVGIYGQKFTKAGKSVMELFSSRGFTTIINDDLTSKALGIVIACVAIFCAGLAALISHFTHNSTSATVGYSVVAFVIGGCVASIPVSVVSSTIATIIVCFSENPALFSDSHPNQYNLLVDAWCDIYPDEMKNAGFEKSAYNSAV